MADLPIDELDGRTPLQAAQTPRLDEWVRGGMSGLVRTVPDGQYPGSDVANMGILGYDPRIFHTGRAPIEAAAMDIETPAGRIAFRCNLVSVKNDRMHDFTSGHISTDDAGEVLRELSEAFRDRGIDFHTGVSYRHIALMSDDLLEAECTPPHDIPGKEIDPFLPQGEGSVLLRELMAESRDILARSDINRRRRADGNTPVTMMWLWGQGRTPELEPFRNRNGIGGGIVTAVDIIRGIGKLAGLETPVVPGATGFIDTDYEAKMSAALDILERDDFVYIHIEAPDEAGHMGDVNLKIRAIEDFDLKIVGPVLDYARGNPNSRVLVLPDHPTPCAVRTHTADRVPCAVFGEGILPDESTAYDEESARRGSLRFDAPWDLLDFLLNH